jgi:hypothetical protein
MILQSCDLWLKSEALPRRANRLAAAACLLSTVLSGCASQDPASYTAPVEEGLRSATQAVEVISTVVATDETPPGLDAPIGQGKEAAQGAAAGGGIGLLVGVLAAAGGGPLGAYFATIVTPTLTVGGAAGGAAAGWSTAVPKEDAAAVRAALSQSRFELSAEVARRIEVRLPSVGKIAVSPDGRETPDLRIEVAVDRWGLAGGAGSDPLTGFYIETSYRVVRGSDGATIAERSVIQGGPQRTISAWTRDNAAALSKAIDETLSRVAEAVTDGAFLVYDFHVLRPGVVRGNTCGLRPVSPSPIYRFGPYESGHPRVDSLTPDLVWESFPSKADVEDDTGHILARVSDIRYDLRVWKDVHGGPGDVVYERTGLQLTSRDGQVDHLVDTPLAPGTRYLWSVRARFRLDGAERVTRWAYDVEIDMQAVPLGYFGRHPFPPGCMEDPYRQSCAMRHACVDDSIPPMHYFGFSTP